MELIAGEGLRGVLQLMAALHESGSSPERFYEAAVEAVVTTAGADRAALLLCDPDGVMRFRAWRGLSDDYRRAVEGHTPWSADDAAPILVPEAGAAPGLEEFWPAFAAEGIAALAFVPLIHRERLVGNFMLYHDKPHDFSASEIAVAEIVAGQVALALGRRRAEEAERASALRLAALQRVTAELSVAVMVDDVAAVVLGTARAELGARSASLCLLAGDDLEIAAAVGYPDEVMTHWRRFPLDGDLPASEAVRTGRAIFLRSAAERDALYPVFGSSPVVQDSAFAMVPLGDDPPVGCLVFGFPEPREFPPQDQAYLAAVAGQCASAFSRARLYEDRERSRAVAAFLAEASAALGSSLETEELASLTAEIAAGFLADWCAVFVREEGRIVPVSIAHDDAQRAAAARALLERCPVSLSDPLEALRGLDIGAALTIPLMVRDRAIGALALANQRPRPLGPDTLELAQELASRIAVALDHARSYRQQARLAQMLQANLLPPSLPEIPGLELAACHAAGSAGVDVGGDFYDVFPVDARRFVLVLGDVCGKGVDAAAIAALVRHTARSAALTDPSPAAIVGHLNDVLLRETDPGRYEPRFCTAVVALVSPSDQSAAAVTLAVAGHPLPLVRRSDGTVSSVGSPGSLVGVTADAVVAETRLRLDPGDALVCYTDGVTERRNGAGFFEIGGLTRTLAATDGDARALAAAVEHAVLTFAPEPPGDDLAILVLRTSPPAP